jgi:ABC-2 type transport system permease protein
MMINLLKIEWLKLKSYKAFIILGLFFVVGVFAANYMVFLVNKNLINKSGLISFSPYSFENTWQSTSYATGYILLLPALLLILLFTNEYTFKTHRQNILDGLNRKQFIDVKLVMALLFAIVATVLVAITAMGFGFASGSPFSTHGIKFVGYFFLKALTYNLFAILISVLVKKTGFATGIFFIYLGAENFISQIADVLSMKLRADKGTDLGSVGDYFPMNAADGLLTFPDNVFKTVSKNFMPSD